MKQLQYLKSALVSRNGNRFREIVKDILFNYFNTVEKGINSGL